MNFNSALMSLGNLRFKCKCLNTDRNSFRTIICTTSLARGSEVIDSFYGEKGAALGTVFFLRSKHGHRDKFHEDEKGYWQLEVGRRNLLGPVSMCWKEGKGTKVSVQDSVMKFGTGSLGLGSGNPVAARENEISRRDWRKIVIVGRYLLYVERSTQEVLCCT